MEIFRGMCYLSELNVNLMVMVTQCNALVVTHQLAMLPNGKKKRCCKMFLYESMVIFCIKFC